MAILKSNASELLCIAADFQMFCYTNVLMNFPKNSYVVLLGIDSNTCVGDLAAVFDLVISVLVSLGLTINARKLGGRLSLWPNSLMSPLQAQRCNNPGAKPFVHIENCHIWRLTIIRRRKSRRRVSSSVVCGSRWTGYLTKDTVMADYLSLYCYLSRLHGKEHRWYPYKGQITILNYNYNPRIDARRRFLQIAQSQKCVSADRSPRKMSLKYSFHHQRKSAFLTYFQFGWWGKQPRWWRIS